MGRQAAYSFETQFRKGQRQEQLLDRYFSGEFHIRPASRAEERCGIDRHFKEKRRGHTCTVQYKADKTAARTGNAFIETVSVDTSRTPGWVHTCQADFIVYYIVGSGPAYVVRPSELRKQLNKWQRKYPERRIPNKGYHTVGILVPLDEIERVAYKVVNI